MAGVDIAQQSVCMRACSEERRALARRGVAPLVLRMVSYVYAIQA